MASQAQDRDFWGNRSETPDAGSPDPTTSVWVWDRPDDYSRMDIAITHHRNEVLRQRKGVQEFLKKLGELKALDQQAFLWLANIPFELDHEAIPLFEDPDTDTDYHIRPAHAKLPEGKKTANPHHWVRSLSATITKLGEFPDLPLLVFPLGHLFVNKPSSKESGPGRLSKWTGYAVYFDLDLNLWIVFDKKSLSDRHTGWYPAQCRLFTAAAALVQRETKKGGGDVGDDDRMGNNPAPVSDPDVMIDAPLFDMARLMMKGTELSFASAKQEISRTMASGSESIYLDEADDTEVRSKLPEPVRTGSWLRKLLNRIRGKR